MGIFWFLVLDVMCVSLVLIRQEVYEELGTHGLLHMALIKKLPKANNPAQTNQRKLLHF